MNCCPTIHSRLVLSLFAPCLLSFGRPPSAPFDAHKWEIVEIFSTPDGSVQFIEWFNTDNDEEHLSLESVSSNAHVFNFPVNLPSANTANHRFLIGTAAFAALPGAPAPDYIMPAGFFNPSGDTLTYTGGDDVTFGVLPSNGTSSINRNGAAQPNSPTNFAGTIGSIVAGGIAATFASFGAGCPNGAGGQTMAVSANPPVLGSSFTITFSNTPSSLVIGLMGLSNLVGFGVAGVPPLPFALAGLGMPGCSLLVSADLFTVLVSNGTWQLSVPNSPSLAGLSVYVQGFGQAQSANALGFITSNAGRAVVGNH
jgi:hypothetical protein